MSLSVLWVDADREFTEIGSQFLRSQGCAVETCPDAETCLLYLSDGLPDLLILDEESVRTGMWKILTLVRDRATNQERVVILTGDDPPDCLAELTGLQVTHCIQKPYSLKLILEAAAVPVV